MKVTVVPTVPDRVLLVPGDLHFDKQDQEAIDLMVEVARDVGVTDVCLVGDTFESAGISTHPGMRKVRAFRHGKATIKSEGAAARPTISALRKLARPGGLHVLTGNHEHWWAGVQDEYPGLADTPWFELYGDLFDGWHIHEEYAALRYGPLLVCHGHRLRGSLAKYSAASVLANYPGQNTLYGHTHRIDEATTPTYKYGTPVAHGAFTIGHLKSRDEELKDPFMGPHSEKHQQGFGLVRFFDRAGAESDTALGNKPVVGFDVTKVRIHRDTHDRPVVTLDGKVYR